MTTTTQQAVFSPPSPAPSTLPFDPRDLVEMRVLPAQFARMVGVSKQAVSKAIAIGKITLGPDGRLDPKKALREYLNNSDPARVRVRTFRQAMTETEALRVKVADLSAEAERLRAEVETERQYGDDRAQAAQYRTEDDAAQRLARLLAVLGSRLDAARMAHDAGTWDEWTDDLVAEVYYGDDAPACNRSQPVAEACSDKPEPPCTGDATGVSSRLSCP